MKGNSRRLLAIFLMLMLLSADICAIAEAAATLALPSALQIIDEKAFYGNTSIEKVIVPAGTTEIRSKAFAGSSMTELVLPDSLTFIAEDAFEGCGEFALTVPENCYTYDRCVELGLIKQEAPDPSVIESVHPYPDDFDYTWIYAAGEAPQSITLTFSDDTETEDGADFICLYTLDDVLVGRYSGTELAGQSVTISGTGFKLRLVSDEARETSNTYYGFKLNSIIPNAEAPFAFESITAESASVMPGETIRWSVETTGGKEPVSYDYTILLGAEKVADGTAEASETIEYVPIRAGEYKLSVTARDSGDTVLPAQVGGGVVVMPSTSYPESEHPYAANTDQRWIYAAEENVEKLNVTFSQETYTQRGYDFIYLYDQYGAQIGRYQYTDLAGKTVEITGSAFSIRLTSNAVVHKYGFSITNIEKIYSGPLAFVSLTADKKQLSVGDLITWKMETEGGERPVTHEYTIMLNGEDVFSNDVIRPEAIEYVPMRPGEYTISVVARDAQGNTLPAQTGTFSATERDVTAEEVFTYTVINDTQARITGYTGTDTAIIMPETLDGYEVAEIGSGAFRNNAELVSISLPDTVTKIAADAFNNCDALRSVELGQKVTSVGARAFNDCDALRAFTFPDSVTSTGVGVLRHCDTLTRVDFSASWVSAKESIVADCPRLTKIVLPEGMTAVPEQAFRSCANLQEVSFPSTLQFIRESAFHGCTNLRQIHLPDQLEGIYKHAFRETALTAIDVPASVTYLSGFYGCRQLTEVRLHKGLTEIGSNAFDGCTSLAEVDIPEGVTVVSSYAFNNCQSLKAIDLPDSVNSIGEFCFSNCSSLESFHYPLSMNAVVCDTGSVRNGAIFADCVKLESITVPEGITFIPKLFFRGANCLKNVTLPSTLETISSSAFENCTAMESMVFPAGLKVIRPNAFAGCTALTAADLPDTVTEIGEHAFDGCVNLESFHYPLSMNAVVCDTGFMHDGAIFTDCVKLESITVPEGITFIPKFFFRGANCLKNVTLPSTLETIFSGAFENCTAIERMQFPDGLKMIHPNAFAGCTALISADLPDTVTGIGENAFDGCINLESFHYPLSLERVITDAGWVHFGEVLKNCPKLTSVTIPEGVTHIPGYFFRNSDYLQYVSIPSTLTTIGSRAFENCSAFIQTYISPNVTSVGEDVFANCDQLTVWCEYGSTILAYCQENAVGYYYLTPDGVNIPSGTLYKGDEFNIYGYARASVPLTDVTATIWDSTGTNVVRTISVNPGILDYDLSDTVNAHLPFSELPVGSYRFTLTAKTDISEELWADTGFTIIPPPLRVYVSGLDGLTGAVGNDFAFGGMIYSNYPMTSVTVTLKNVSTDTVCANFTCAPNATSYSLNGTTGIVFAQLPAGNYRLTIVVSGNGETRTPTDTFFSIGAYDQEISGDVFDQLVSFAQKPGNQMIFSQFNEGSAFLSSIDWSDELFMSIRFRSQMCIDAISQRLNSTDVSHFMVKRYKKEVASIIDKLDPTIDLTNSSSTYIKMVESLSKDLRILTYVDNEDGLVPKYMKEMSKNINAQLDSLGKVCDIAQWVTDTHNGYSAFLKNYENSLMILEAYGYSMGTANPELEAAMTELAEDYTSKVSKALNLLTNMLIDNMSKQMYSAGLKLFKNSTTLMNQAITGSAGNYSIMLSVVNFAIDATLEFNNLDKLADNQINAMIQIETFGQAVDSYYQAFGAVYEGDTSYDALNRLGICYQLCCISGTRMYESLAKTAWYEKNYEANDAFMSKYAELWRLEYAEPFDRWR